MKETENNGKIVFAEALTTLFQQSLELENMTVAFKTLELFAKTMVQAKSKAEGAETLLNPSHWTPDQLNRFLDHLKTVCDTKKETPDDPI